MTNRFNMMDRASIPHSRPKGPEGDRPFTIRERNFNTASGSGEPDEDALARHMSRHWAKLLLDTYAYRSNCFPDGLFADPAWDMLLDLTHAKLVGKRVSVSSLCIAARVPATTALRRIGDLVDKGLAIRIRDQNDGRRVFVELTDDGFARMERYLNVVRIAVAAPPGEPRRRP